MSMGDLTAAQAARLATQLDKRYRDRQTGRIYTFRETLEAGEYAYVLEHEWSDGSTSRGLIEHANAAEALEREPSSYYPGADDARQGLQFATFTECPKLVADHAALTLPVVRVTRETFEILEPTPAPTDDGPEISDAEWAHLTGGAR